MREESDEIDWMLRETPGRRRRKSPGRSPSMRAVVTSYASDRNRESPVVWRGLPLWTALTMAVPIALGVASAGSMGRARVSPVARLAAAWMIAALLFAATSVGCLGSGGFSFAMAALPLAGVAIFGGAIAGAGKPRRRCARRPGDGHSGDSRGERLGVGDGVSPARGGGDVDRRPRGSARRLGRPGIVRSSRRAPAVAHGNRRPPRAR